MKSTHTLALRHMIALLELDQYFAMNVIANETNKGISSHLANT